MNKAEGARYRADENLDLGEIVLALEAAGWVYNFDSKTWTQEDVSGLTFAQAIIHDIRMAAKWRRTH